jgi:GH15 family glucan-1,4-alpha-glucosidase
VNDCGEWTPFVRRSALVLKTLVAEGSGAIAAPSQRHFPNESGGRKTGTTASRGCATLRFRSTPSPILG